MGIFIQLKEMVINNINIIIAIFVFTVIDLILGLCKAFKHKNYSSYKLKNGLLKFLLYFLCIIAIVFIDIVFEVNFTKYVSIFICVVECTSIIENLCNLGVKLPKNVIQFFKERNEDNEK